MAFAQPWKAPKPASGIAQSGAQQNWAGTASYQPQPQVGSFTPQPARPATAEDAYAQAAKNSADYYAANPNAPPSPHAAPGQTEAEYEASLSAPIQATGIPEPYSPPGTGGLTPDQAILNQQANRPTQLQDYYAMLNAHGAPTQQQDYYNYITGQVGKNTNTEDLYNARKGGYDPAAEYEDARAVKAINDQAAARGGYNSGASTRAINDYYANVGAQRSHDLASLAGAADAGRSGLYSAYGNAANSAGGAESDYYNLLGHAAGGASGEESDYYRGLTSAATDIARGKAGIVQDTAAAAGKVFSDAQFEKIQAELKKAGVDVSQIKNDKESLQTIISLYAGGGAGGGAKGFQSNYSNENPGKV